MGNTWSKIKQKIGIERPSRGLTEPLLPPNTKPIQPIQPIKVRFNNQSQIPVNSRKSVQVSSSAGPETAVPAAATTTAAAAAATTTAVPARATVGPAIATTSPVAPQLDIHEIRRRMNVYCFKKSRNIVQIHQRHATTCANVLNKGFECTDKIKGPSTICTLWDINELAPNTSLTAI